MGCGGISAPKLGIELGCNKADDLGVQPVQPLAVQIQMEMTASWGCIGRIGRIGRSGIRGKLQRGATDAEWWSWSEG